MASLEFDIGLDDPPEGSLESETKVTPTNSSLVSSLISTIKSKFRSGGPSAYKLSRTSAYSDESAFIILRDFLQPNTTLSFDTVVKSLLDLLPEDASGSSEVYSFGAICLDLAEQIPYHHPSHQKMARLLEYIGQSTKVNARILTPRLDGRGVYNRYNDLGSTYTIVFRVIITS